MVSVKGKVGELGKQSSLGSKVSVAKRKGKEEGPRLCPCPGADVQMPSSGKEPFGDLPAQRVQHRP